MLKEKKGSILSFVMVAFSLVVTFSLALASSSLIQNTMANRETVSEQAFLSAKSMSEYLIVSGSDIVADLANKPLNTEVVLIDENHLGYEDLGKVTISIVSSYVDDLAKNKKINIVVSATKDGATSEIKSVWNQSLKSTEGASGVSFSANLWVKDCSPANGTGASACTNPNVEPQRKNLANLNPNQASYTVDPHTLLTQNGTSFSASKVTHEQQLERFEQAYETYDVMEEKDYKNIKTNCVHSGYSFAQINPNNPVATHMNRANCIIDTKDNKDPVSNITDNMPRMVFFEIPEGQTLTVFVNIHQDNEIDPYTIDLTSWEQNTAFIVSGSGILNIIYDYQSNNGKAKSIFLPQIYQRDPSKTTVNIFFPKGKDDKNIDCNPEADKNKKCTVVENVVMNYGFTGYHMLIQQQFGVHDGAVYANIYMPNSTLVINGIYNKNFDVQRRASLLLDGEIVTKSIELNKAQDVYYEAIGAKPYAVHHGSFFTSTPWRLMSTSNAGSEGDGAFEFEAYGE